LDGKKEHVHPGSFSSIDYIESKSTTVEFMKEAFYNGQELKYWLKA
jgi:hypothetical protein